MPMLLEVFTDGEDESEALEKILNFVVDHKARTKNNIKKFVKNIVGEKVISTLKPLLK